MPENHISRVMLQCAAGTPTAGYDFPTQAATITKWRIKRIAWTANVTVATNGTDYITVAFTVGGTTLATSLVTSSVSMTAGTVAALTLTGTGATLEVSQTTPLLIAITHAASGKAADLAFEIEYEVIRV